MNEHTENVPYMDIYVQLAACVLLKMSYFMFYGKAKYVQIKTNKIVIYQIYLSRSYKLSLNSKIFAVPMFEIKIKIYLRHKIMNCKIL